MAGALIRQAQSEARVRFGPQRFALQELIAQAVQTRDLALHAAAGANRAIQAVIGTARGETTRNYAHAQAQAQGTNAMVAGALAPLGAGADPFRAAIAREGGVATSNLNAGQTNALQELTQRRLEAASGSAYAQQAATRQFSTDIGKVDRSYLELAGEQGAFTQGRTAELRKEAADRAFQRDLAVFSQKQQNKRARIQARTQRRGQNLSQQTQERGQNLSHADRQAAIRARRQAAARNRVGKNGPKLLSQSAHTKFYNDFQAALRDARGARAVKVSPGQARDVLTSGVPAATEKDPKTGNTVHKPGIKSHPRLAAIVAVDLAYTGGISRRTMNILHRNGYSVRQLGLKIYSGPPAGGRGLGGPYGTGRMGR